MAFKGWIYLHRKLLDNAIWTSEERFDKRSAWIDLILHANHADKNILVDGVETTIKRGQFMTSKRKLAARWGWDVKTVSKYLNALQKARMVYVDSTRRHTLITILKYAEYQDLKAFGGKNPPTVNPTLNGTQRPHSVHTDSLQTTNVINDNECRTNEKQNTAPPVGGSEWQ